jgi:D-alanyl-D-alanine carboxypeptidase
MAESEAPGALAGVWEEGEEACLVSLGYADTASSRPLQPGDRFRIGDLTWTFTATVVLQLVDEGRLGLDDPLLAHFPQARQVAGITVRQVLDHTSGLFDYTEDGGFQGLLLADPGRRWSPEELVGISFMHDPYFPPGTGWRYSRTNCIIAGLLVERCTAGRLEEEIDRRIVSRLGLLNTYFPSSSNIPGMYCRGYELREAGQRSDVTFERNTSWVWASGGMISNLEDLATFFGALAGGGLVGGGAWREAQKRVAAPLLGAEIGRASCRERLPGAFRHASRIPMRRLQRPRGREDGGVHAQRHRGRWCHEPRREPGLAGLHEDAGRAVGADRLAAHQV